MNEYEKYRLQWMLDHDYTLPDLLERLSDIAMNEDLDEIQNPRVMLNEAFERLEYEQGFDNEEIAKRRSTRYQILLEMKTVKQLLRMIQKKKEMKAVWNYRIKAKCLNFFILYA